MHTTIWQWLSSIAPLPVKEFYRAAVEFYLTPWFWIALAAILAAERLWPVTRRTSLLPASMVEDAFWLNIELAISAIFIPFLAGILFIIWQWTTGGFHVTGLSRLPGIARVGISLVIWDFLEYANHRVRHHFRMLWHFHSIHHSQRDLNPFTDGRVHVMDFLTTQSMYLFPMFALQLTPFQIMGTGAAIGWFARLSHSNVRTNFGPIGLLLVSPQHHRVHHSIEPAHQDKNFGLLLTVWDRLFGTFWPDRTVYPATGVQDVNFTLPTNANPLSWVGIIVRQLVYPFKRIAMESRRPVPPSDTPSRMAVDVTPIEERQTAGRTIKGIGSLR